MVNHGRASVHSRDHYYHLEFQFDDDNNDPINVDCEFFQSRSKVESYANIIEGLLSKRENV